jgi:predicted nucleic acid-binding Zn ribbon protein
MKDKQLHSCPNCGVKVKTYCEEYICPLCDTHIIDPPGKRCELCEARLRRRDR